MREWMKSICGALAFLIFAIAPLLHGQISESQRDLARSAYSGNVAEVTKLLSNHVDPNVIVETYDSPLLSATKQGHDDIVKLLLEHGANANLGDKYGDTPLEAAIKSTNSAMVRLLIDHGANVNASNKSGYTMLSFAIDSTTEILKLVLDGGANHEITDEKGNTPLLQLVESAEKANSDASKIEILLDHGANIEAKNKDGLTSLAIAINRCDLKEYCALDVIRVLLDHHADMNYVLSGGDPPLWVAIHSKNEDLLHILLDHHANVNAKSKTGDSALHVAVFEGQDAMVRELLQHGAQVDIKNNDGDTPLCQAVSYSHVELNKRLEVINALLNFKADVNSKCHSGTPLEQANFSEENAIPIMKVLLDAGADINAKVDSGDTALATAQQMYEQGITKNKDVIYFLESAQQRQAMRQALIEKIIQHAGDPIPEEARGDFIQANTLFKAAQVAGEVDAAIALYRKAIDLAPWYGNAWYNLSLALEKDGKLDDAREALFMYKSILKQSQSTLDQAVLDREYALKAEIDLSDSRRVQHEKAIKVADTLRKIFEDRTMYRFWVYANKDYMPCTMDDVTNAKCLAWDSVGYADRVGNGHDGTAIGSSAKISIENDHVVLALGTQQFCFPAGSESDHTAFDANIRWYEPDLEQVTDCAQPYHKVLHFQIERPYEGFIKTQVPNYILGGDGKTTPTIPGTLEVIMEKCTDDACSHPDIAYYWYKP